MNKNKRIIYCVIIIILIILTISLVIISNNKNKGYYKEEVFVLLDPNIKWEIPSYLNEKHVYEYYYNGKLTNEYEYLFLNENSFIDIKILNNDKMNDDNGNIELDIYSDNNMLIANFNYNRRNYIIKTNNIEKEVLLDLIKSIIDE